MGAWFSVREWIFTLRIKRCGRFEPVVRWRSQASVNSNARRFLCGILQGQAR